MLPPRSLTAALAGALVSCLAASLLALPAAGSSYAGTGATAAQERPHDRKQDPRRSRGLFVDPRMPAAQAARDDKRYRPLGSRAQALWITDYYGKKRVEGAVRAYTRRAERAHKTPVLAIYNIPDRDCGLYSSQDEQITDRYYRAWVKRAAAGVRGSKPIVVVEPDAIPFIGNPQCTGRGDRLGLLRLAVKLFDRAGAWVYLDAGHSGWQTPEHMAPLLKQAGIGRARGFSTNVGNFRPTGDEQRYAKALVRQLAKRKVKGAHYVIETARNGAEQDPVDGDVCNPTWARIGQAPRLLFRGAFDGRLWIKHPGESDGECNGGPSSGAWWPEGAQRLLSKQG